MALTVVWSQTALDDVDAIAAYIFKDSPFYTKAVTEKLLKVAEGVVAFPQIGRVVPEINQTHIRERFVYSYRLIYEIKPTQIEVLTGVHGRRLLETD
ncbi:MAG: type II toxin-antitoxin system RelE/ParE family toxin [Methylotenera sp.]|nr:type II toxin-antitoxin system RelE/ParE family toxin [Methylotenera sp.]MDO9232277.1 type II toxin-antitoxin system RelE/ParE family toxin [Methylotenera sp.]MDO9388101.1 type II toxin-antitoxin system RelE/ParE family toxin [Methylotenera sp.]MDP2102193.1 type II toxin-antitoxin system RelE/ParE family toxin [Methylotenera sp.]MDP2281153.1 type II toxin-antitoxin system RelE/ParE family toxin [Methylotenera sp.]